MANTGAKRWRGQAVDAGVPEGSLRDPMETNTNRMSSTAWAWISACRNATAHQAARHSALTSERVQSLRRVVTELSWISLR